MSVLFGSQTGTAEEVAYRIHREAYLNGHEFDICSMNEFEISKLPLVSPQIYVCSTTGEGEEPDNMKRLWKYLLRKDHPSNMLSNVKFAVFGLGDSSYECYNYAGKKLYRRLCQLGALPLIERGDGNDQDRLGYEDALNPWLDRLFKCTEKRSLAPMVHLVPTSESSIDFNSVANAELIANERITGDHPEVKDVRRLIFKTDLLYDCGDVAVVKPENGPEEVDALLDAIGWSQFALQSYVLAVHRKGIKLPVKMIALRDLVLRYLDINRPPTRYFFQLIAQFVDETHSLGSDHREKLVELGSTTEDGIQSYLDYIWRPRRKPAEVLRDFTSVSNIPLDWVLDLFPWIKPRSFSIASYQPGKEIHLAAALVQYKTIMKEERRGLCSEWFKQMSIGTQLHMTVNKGSMHLPSEPTAPIMFLCAGTGIAPMISMIEKLDLLPKKPLSLLFYGCRKVEHDALYIETLRSKYAWLQIRIAGSRDQPKGTAKVYLQDIILANSRKIAEILPTAYIYLSGNSKLPGSVKKALASITSQHLSFEGDVFIKHLVSTKRFQSETWS